MCNPNTEGRDPETGGHDTVTIENTKDKPLAVRVIIRSDLFIYCIAYCRLVYITVSDSVYRYIVAIISCGRYLFNLLCPKYIMVLVTAVLLLVA